MKFIKSKESELHSNYLSRVIQVNEDDFMPHPNPEVTALKRCFIGKDTIYTVIVNINSKPGKYVFFPALTQINNEFLRFANLYRDPLMNNDPNAKPGLFENNGRVKSVKLKGSISDGFLIELSTVLDFILSTFNIEINENDIKDGTWFDTIEHDGKTCWLSKKFIPKINVQKHAASSTQVNHKSRKKKQEKKFNKVINEQFKFHYDTKLIKKNPFVIQPEDFIHISAKWHGTSAIFANVLCKQKLNWKQKIAKFLTGCEFNKYDFLYSSRTIILNKFIYKKEPKSYNNFSAKDVWKEAFKIVKPELDKGITVYAEIVGYNPTNSYIQKGYDYGCVPRNSNEDYTYGKHFKIMVYRVTMTNPDGKIHEYSPREVQIWSRQHNLTPVIEYYYGMAKDLYPELEITDHWHRDFWDRMSNDQNFNMELDSPDCINKVPHEGVVIKIDDMIPRAFKLKCFKFCNKEAKELDAGITNIEDDQSFINE